MSVLTEVLGRYGVDPDDKGFAADLDRALGMLPGVSATALSHQEQNYLAMHAGGNAAAVVAAYDPVRARSQQIANAVQTAKETDDHALTLIEAAKRLGIDRTRVAHRLRNGELWAVSIGGHRRIPSWQIAGGQLLPQLPAITAAIPYDAHPLDVADLMNTPQDELGGRSPVAHLIGGGDPAPVVALVSQLNRW